jgi:hypothetical protein
MVLKELIGNFVEGGVLRLSKYFKIINIYKSADFLLILKILRKQKY